MPPDQRLRSLALRLLDTAQTLAEQQAAPLRAIIESAEATDQQRFEALAQLAALSQEIVRKLSFADVSFSGFDENPAGGEEPDSRLNNDPSNV